MKKIVEYNEGTRSYDVGDVVYFDIKAGKPTCKAIAVKESNGRWLFRAIGRQPYYVTTLHGLIPFSGKPFIFAKEIEVKEEQP